MKLTRLRRISIGEIKEAGRAWAVQLRSNPRAPSYKESARFFTYEVAAAYLGKDLIQEDENSHCPLREENELITKDMEDMEDLPL